MLSLPVLTTFLAFLVPRGVFGLEGWTHGWDTALASQFIDFGYQPLSQAQAIDVASHYGIVSLEKCSGGADKTGTEAAIWASAALLKAAKPSIKVMFYLATDLGGLQCYRALETYRAHPEWWLRDDAGALVNNSKDSSGDGIPLPDYTVPAARAWWASIPLNGTTGGGGGGVAALIDGVLADGTGDPCLRLGADISPARCAALAAGKAAMVEEMQGIFTAANGGVVMQNGVDMYPGNEQNNLPWLAHSNGFQAEHFAVFESVLPSGKLNVTRVEEFFDVIAAAAATGKLVVVSTWPGLCTTPFTPQGYPSWPNNTQPTSNDGWRAALLAKHTFALAGFLIMAEENVWMAYEGWYNGFTQGAVSCPDAPSTCAAPSPWYPDLGAPLGPPQGRASRVKGTNLWTRAFAHANVTLNLDDPDASFINWL